MSILVLIAAALLAAEWLQWRRRCRYAPWLVAPLAAWVAVVPLLRAAAWTAACWGGMVLWQSGDAAVVATPVSPRLVLAIDVSPSMQVADAGPLGHSTRAQRARELARDIVGRLGPHRISVLAFYTGARPVVVDTVDPAVADNILNDLPLEHAFASGRTNLYAVLGGLREIARDWPSGSARLVLFSDGDSVPPNTPPRVERAFREAVVIGVGDPSRGTMIAGAPSRQDGAQLRRLATVLGGQYIDGNRAPISDTVLPPPATPPVGDARVTLALLALGLGALLELLLVPALAGWGLRRRCSLTDTSSLDRSPA